jgi:hypothetical protein
MQETVLPIVNNLSHWNPTGGIRSNGHHLCSNPNNGKVFTCFSGTIEEFYGKTTYGQNPLALLDMATGINRPYHSIPEINNKTPVSAIHLLNHKVMIVGHGKNMYFLQENFNIGGYYQNLFTLMFRYSLKITQTIFPKLDAHDSIHTIHSSKDHLLSISSQGHITKWKKTENGVDNNQQTIQCTQKFFSSGVNNQENILCLGLENGKLFVLDINNFTHKIIDFFPDSITPINWINSYKKMILFACLHNQKSTHVSQHELLYDDDSQKNCSNSDKINCCKKHSREMLKNNQNILYQNNVKELNSVHQSVPNHSLTDTLSALKQAHERSIKDIEQKIETSNLINDCQEHVFHALLPAHLLKNQNIPNNNKQPFLGIENIKNILAQVNEDRKNETSQKIYIQQIHLINQNQAIVYLQENWPPNKSLSFYDPYYSGGKNNIILMINTKNPEQPITQDGIFKLLNPNNINNGINNDISVKKHCKTIDGFPVFLTDWKGCLGEYFQYKPIREKVSSKLYVSIQRFFNHGITMLLLNNLALGLLAKCLDLSFFGLTSNWIISAPFCINVILGGMFGN